MGVWHIEALEKLETQIIRLDENLNRLMKKKSLTITTVASNVGMNKSTLHNYCNGVIPRNIVTLYKLADFLGVSFSSLIFGENSVEETSTKIDCAGNCTITIQISHDKEI